MNMCANALKMQDRTNRMVNVSLCISISQVSKDTSCSRQIFSFPIGVCLPLAWAIKSLNKTIVGTCFANIEQPKRVYTFFRWSWSQTNRLIFLLKCDGAKVATYVPPLQRIRSSRSSTDIFGCLNFGLDRLSSFQSSRLSHTLSFALLLHRSPFQVFNLLFHIFLYYFILFYCFFFFFFYIGM